MELSSEDAGVQYEPRSASVTRSWPKKAELPKDLGQQQDRPLFYELVKRDAQKKNNQVTPALLGLRMYYKILIIKTGAAGTQIGQTDQWCRTDSSK